MEALLNESFLSWTTFIEIALVVGVVLFISFTFHLFDELSWHSSIGYHVFFYFMVSLLVICFILVKPFYHAILIAIVFGIFHRQIFPYGKAIVNLFFSGIKIGDRITIGENTGVLSTVNLGGMHLETEENKIFYPFNQWSENRIILESQDGKIPVSFTAKDTKERNQSTIRYDMEKLLFRFPYIHGDDISIHQSEDEIKVSTKVSSSSYRESLMQRVEESGYKIVNAIKN